MQRATCTCSPSLCMTTRVKINQNVDIHVLAKVVQCIYMYIVHLKVEHCQTLRVVSTFTGQNESTIFDW